MRKKSVKKNYIYNLMFQILAIVTPIITTPYLARRLGPSGNGIYGYTISIVTYFILFGSLGINLYAQREIAYVQDNKKKRSKVFSEIFILKTITMIISMICFYFFFCINGEYSIYFKILLLEMVANIFDISWLYSGLEEFKTISIRNIFIRILSVVMILTLIKGPGDVNRYIFIYTFTTLISSLALWLNLKEYINFTTKKLNIIKHIKPTIALFIPQIAIQVYVVLDKTMLGSILNDMNEVGYYEQAQKIVKLLLTVITSAGTVMLPRIAKEFADNNMDKIHAYMRKTFNFTFLLASPLIFGIIVVSNRFVPLFFGTGYGPVIPIMCSMSIIILFIGLSTVIGTQYLLPLKKQKEYTISVIIGAIVNLVLNFLLISKFKSMGACIGTIVAEFTVTSVQLYYVRDKFKITELLSLAKNYIFAGIIMFIACYFVGIYVPRRLITVICQVSTGIIVYFGVLLLIRDKFVIQYTKIGLNYIKRLFKK